MTSFEYLIQQKEARIIELSDCLKRMIEERDKLRADKAHLTYQSHEMAKEAALLRAALDGAKANLMKCGYDELNKVCNQRDEASAKLDEARKLLVTRVEASRLSEANLEIQQLRAEIAQLGRLYEAANRAFSAITQERDKLEVENNNLRQLVGWSDGKLDVEQLINERDHLKERLEIETSGETCVKCGGSWNPSLVESGWCIFCIQKETAEDRDLLNIELAEKNDAAHEFRLQVGKLQAEVEIQKGNVVHQQDECSRLRSVIEKIENELAQSQSNFNALLKTNGNRIDENAELKAENNTLDFYLIESNKRVSKLEDDVKLLQRKTSGLLYE